MGLIDTRELRIEKKPLPKENSQSELKAVNPPINIEIQQKEKPKEPQPISTEKQVPASMKIRIDLTGTKYKVLKEAA